jgi:hypothetical protein
MTRREVFNFGIDKMFKDNKIKKLEMPLFKLHSSDIILSNKNSYNLPERNNFITHQ